MREILFFIIISTWEKIISLSKWRSDSLNNSIHFYNSDMTMHSSTFLTIILCLTFFISCNRADKISGTWVNIYPDNILEIELRGHKISVTFSDGRILQTEGFDDPLKFQLVEGGEVKNYQVISFKKNDQLVFVCNDKSQQFYDTLTFREKKSFSRIELSIDNIRSLLESHAWKLDDNGQAFSVYFLTADKFLRCNDGECIKFNWDIVNTDSIYFLKTSKFGDAFYLIEQINDDIDLFDLKSGIKYKLVESHIGSIFINSRKSMLEGNWVLDQMPANGISGYFSSISFHSEGNFMPFDASLESGDIIMGNWSLSSDGNLIFLSGRNLTNDFLILHEIDDSTLILIYRSHVYRYIRNPV